MQIIARLADAPVFFISTTTNFAPKTFKEFIDYAKKNEVRYASAGIGAYQHVNTEILAKRAGGLQLLHIPFKDGGSGILKDVAGGDIHVTWFNITNPVGMIKAGKVRPLAIAAPKRLEAWPDVPTLDELGFTGFRPSQWYGGVRTVRRAARDHRQRCTRRSSRQPRRRRCKRSSKRAAWRARADKSVEEAAAWLKQEMETWRRDIADAGIKVDE